MAEFDTSIYRNPQGAFVPKIEDPIERQAKLAQLLQFRNQAAKSELEQQQLRTKLQRDADLTGVYREAGGDQNKLVTLLGQRGFGPEQQALQKQLIDQEKQRADAEKTKAERTKIVAAGMRELAAQFEDSEAGYQNFRAAVAEEYGPNIAQRLPPMAGAGWVQKSIASADQKFELTKPIMKEVDTGQQKIFIDVNPVTNPSIKEFAAQMQMTPAQVAQDARALQQIAEQQRHNRASEGVAYGNLALARQREQREASAPRGQYDADRGIIIDSRTAEARPVTQDGVPIGPKDKQPTESELSSAGYAGRMQRAEAVLSQLPRSADRPSLPEQSARSMGADTAANVVMSSSRQQYRQAQEDWVRAKLRKESGAVIAKDEMDREIDTYFPKIGDLPAVVEQKRLARAQAMEQLRSSSGRARIPANVNDRPALGNFSGSRPPLETFSR